MQKSKIKIKHFPGVVIKFILLTQVELQQPERLYLESHDPHTSPCSTRVGCQVDRLIIK